MTISPQELDTLRDSLRDLLGAGRPDVAPMPDPGWKARWPALVELGVLALCASEDVGGFGNEVIPALLVSRELGAALDGSPFAASVAATYAITRWLEPVERRRELANAILSGNHIPVLAFLDPGSTIAGEVRVNGRAHLVTGVDHCDSFLLVAPGHDTMTFVPRSDRCAAGSMQTFDVSRSCADVLFRDAPALPVRSVAADRERTERLHGLLLAGDAIGGVELMLERTTAYTRERKAFGKVVGGFQAVQHRIVDHELRVRGAALVVSDAAERMTADAPDADRQALLAEAAVTLNAVSLLHDLLQLTGAIGFTWDYGLHFYERRAHLDARLGRNPRQALRSLAPRAGWPQIRGW